MIKHALLGLAWTALVLSLVCLLGGFLGPVHPAGDSLAVFRLPFGGVAMIAAFALRRKPVAALGGAVATVIVMINWLAHHPDGGGGGGQALASAQAGLTLYQQNMLYNSRGNEALVREILEQKPDLIALEEVSLRNLAMLDALRAEYPVQQVCPFRKVGGVAVLTRDYALAERLHCVPDLGLAAVRVVTEQGPLWVAAVHLPWPWPHGQDHKVTQTVAELAPLEGPMVLAGDFNAVGWSHAVARIAAAGGMARVGPYATTFDLPRVGYGVGIDHVLAPDGVGQITVMPKYNSDHHGLLARVYPFSDGR